MIGLKAEFVQIEAFLFSNGLFIPPVISVFKASRSLGIYFLRQWSCQIYITV
jgi:hypothetical protein